MSQVVASFFPIDIARFNGILGKIRVLKDLLSEFRDIEVSLDE